ncbi:Fe-S cluster assembly protein IscX [Thiohalobacter thiocyanaticus]|uniref:Fe-S assembly protein IscX n=1 Tax=Thiohalobacter thiocyanaticus TaxID=585455 RepID=A0A426QMM8_9GAMM|nr:Fe-S cluster assembly protein IscX [Thiohalobacter thiocyanaticus]RRQ23012.1 Fe-S assembly protein IscX [Thiohalobacter thiocyanaticus]
MGLKWTDSLAIAAALNLAHPEADPKYVNFVELRQWILELDEFDDDPRRGGEKALEAIQLAWIEESV